MRSDLRDRVRELFHVVTYQLYHWLKTNASRQLHVNQVYLLLRLMVVNSELPGSVFSIKQRENEKEVYFSQGSGQCRTNLKMMS